MNNIYLQFLKMKSFMLDNTNIKHSVFFGVLSVLLFAVSGVITNRTVDIVSGVLAGFAFGIFLIKLQPIINYFKGQQVKGTN